MTTNYRSQQQQNRDRDRNRDRNGDSDEQHLVERVVRISRVAKVVKGGRHLSFKAVVVVGDEQGHVGIGMGKADAVPDAVRKGAVKARSNMIEVPLKGSTIPHDIVSKYGGSVVMLKPAAPGTGVIAGGAVRAVVELAGVRDILTKSRRSNNPVNVVKATFEGLRKDETPRSRDRQAQTVRRGSQRATASRRSPPRRPRSRSRRGSRGGSSHNHRNIAKTPSTERTNKQSPLPQGEG